MSKELKGDVTFEELMKRTGPGAGCTWSYGPNALQFCTCLNRLQKTQPGIEMNITQIPCTIQAFMNEKNLPLMSS